MQRELVDFYINGLRAFAMSRNSEEPAAWKDADERQRYMGLDHFPYAEPEQIMVRVKVDRVAGNGPWKN